MTEFILHAEPLSAEGFSTFGDVIEMTSDEPQAMNEARFERFRDLAKIDVDETNAGHVAISIARSITPVSMPHRFELLERHPLGSQAFIPMAPFAFTIVVAPAGDSVTVESLRAFSTHSAQGVNYHRGVWHMPLISVRAGQNFLIVDRAPGHDNYDTFSLPRTVVLHSS